jgi:hypothetical protein
VRQSGWHHRPNHPKAAQGKKFPNLSGTALDGREGADGRHLEADIQGVSTRAVDDLVRAMGLTGPSKNQQSRLCEDIDERVQAFVNHPLEGDRPFLWLAAT